MKSLLRRKHDLSNTDKQLTALAAIEEKGLPSFVSKLEQHEQVAISPIKPAVLQVNLGKMCNQVCKHCHVDAGPDRKEIMERETMQYCLDAIAASSIETVDLTGGAPEMNPHFRWFVEEISKLGRQTIVRCNLTIILANPKYHDLPEFYKAHKVNVVSSLPHFTERRTDAQRGDGVFGKSIKALQMLNEVGYGMEGSDLKLDLVYNPSGAFLPGDQATLQSTFKRKLKKQFDIEFNELFTITNLPISRFLEYLTASGNYEEYMTELVNAFNPAAVEGVMCRNTISVGWDGQLYDCDFNQMLDVPLAVEKPHISDFAESQVMDREIFFHNHCYGCTAGAGSSCGGATT